MFNSVQYVRDVCRQRKIPVSQLEKDCGFSNGYLNPKKMTKIPYDRAQSIAEYLNISVEMILTGEETEKSSPVPTQSNRNFIRIAGRDGSYVEKVLTDAQMAAVKAMIEQLPDASEDI